MVFDYVAMTRVYTKPKGQIPGGGPLPGFSPAAAAARFRMVPWGSPVTTLSRLRHTALLAADAALAVVVVVVVVVDARACGDPPPVALGLPTPRNALGATP